MVGEYFRVLTIPSALVKKKAGRAPITKSLRGILKNAKLDEKDHKRHLEKKYL
jgi:hypothetical protein